LIAQEIEGQHGQEDRETGEEDHMGIELEGGPPFSGETRKATILTVKTVAFLAFRHSALPSCPAVTAMPRNGTDNVKNTLSSSFRA
jgi:hypothetical protein